VHVHGRGNAALPEDIVKLLKTQDENYVRTVRAAGLKKIEKLKVHLTVDAQMLSPAALEELEEVDLEVLREAGIIPTPLKANKRSQKVAPVHIMFAEDESEGACMRLRFHSHRLIRVARERAAALRSKIPSGSGAAVLKEEVSLTLALGWKTPDTRGKKKKSAISLDEKEKDGMDLDESEEMRGMSSVCAIGGLVVRWTKANSTQANRTRLLKELSARLHRDRMLRYAERELEMQRSLMGKGAAKKIAGVEKVEDGDGDDLDDESRPSRRKIVDEKTYKPRVYKWKAERKR
jgi:U3 small nucleolar RNA-associated protein 11